MVQADRLGSNGRWLDVPRLAQFNGQVQSWLWCGRAAAAMVYAYYCKAQGKTSEYVGHKTGDPGPGANGKQKDNLRFLGGPHADEIAGIASDGRCAPAQIFERSGWKHKDDFLQRSPKEPIDTDPVSVEKRFGPIVDAIRSNNPVVLYTRLSTSKNGGHIVCVSGFKKLDGELWLRINDPTSPHDDLLGKRNWALIQRHPSSFSEYWVRASRLLEPHPDKPGKRLLSYMEHDKIGRYYVVEGQPVKDDADLVHLLEATPQDEKDKSAKAPPAAPALGGTSLPFEVRGSSAVSADSLVALYHSSERGAGGYFPLADSTTFHCGAHFLVDQRTKVRAVARGEVVAARISVERGAHPWGDTGFVLLRHPIDGGKTLYSLMLHLEREALHPDRASGWLSRLLADAMGGAAGQKPKWRVTEEVPTWKDADKGRFSPVNADPKTTVKPGVYEEKDRLSEDHALYVKLDGGWIRASLQDGEGPARELSPWADFDLAAAAKNSALVKALREGKVAVLDTDKKDGKRRWTVESGEVIGVAGTYLGMPQFHWAVFSKDPVLPGGSLPNAEYGAKDEVKLQSLDLTAHEAGTHEHTKQLLDALDPKKEHVAKLPQGVLARGDLTSFYRTPARSWRSRYLAAKGRCEFNLDVEKMLALERYKSHAQREREEFKKNVKPFLFWSELASADDFPADGVAVYVHPITALRLMAHVGLAQDHDDPPPADVEPALRAQDDVVLLLRDKNGPLAEVEVVVKVDGQELLKEKTDADGQLLLPFQKVSGKDIEISVAQDAVGDKGQLVVVLNESGASRSLVPGTQPADHAFNGTDLLPEPHLGLALRVRQGKAPETFAKWDERALKPQQKLGTLDAGTKVEVERIVYRKDDGKLEAVQARADGQLVVLSSIVDGEPQLEDDPGVPAPSGGWPKVQASWSARIAHLNDHPIFAGRVRGIADGTELQIHFFAILATGAPEHDVELHGEKVKVATQGFAVAFDPHQLVADHDLLNAVRPVYAKVKHGGGEVSLRDEAIAIYPEGRIQDAPPPAAEPAAEAAQTIYAFTEIDRAGTVDRYRTKDGKEPQTRQVAQLSGEVAKRIVSDGGDELFVGGIVREMHLATEAQEHLTAAQALEQQKAALLAIYPDAPVKELFSKPEEAFFRDNGMTVGVCAQDCKQEVCDAGKKTGCTEEIRTRNLLACQNVKPDPNSPADRGRNLCRTAVPSPGRLPVVAVHCYSALGVCNSVRHDKSKCFLQTVVRGPQNEERERWYVSLTMRAKSGDQTVYPYHGGHSGAPAQVGRGVNVRVVVINPQNGNAVVCSMEDYGPSGNTRAKDGNDAVPEAQVERDGMAGWGHICGMSYEAHWKLDFKGRHGDHVALMAFVPASTPLGPLAPGAVVKLRKRATYAQIMGLEKVSGKANA